MIESNIKPIETRIELPFPKIMATKDNTLIILAIGYTNEFISGTLIGGNSETKIGHYSNAWYKNSFYDFNDEITLKNIFTINE